MHNFYKYLRKCQYKNVTFFPPAFQTCIFSNSYLQFESGLEYNLKHVILVILLNRGIVSFFIGDPNS